jgi:hypothetical protein
MTFGNEPASTLDHLLGAGWELVRETAWGPNRMVFVLRREERGAAHWEEDPLDEVR